MFGSETLRHQAGPHHHRQGPDLGLCAAVGLSSSPSKVCQVLEQGSDKLGAFGHGWTYSAHPIGRRRGQCRARHRREGDLPGNAARTGGYFQQRLAETFADHPNVGEVRGDGMLAAVEFVADRKDKTRFDPALKVGARVSAAALSGASSPAPCRMATYWAFRRRWSSSARRWIRSSRGRRPRSIMSPASWRRRGAGGPEPAPMSSRAASPAVAFLHPRAGSSAPRIEPLRRPGRRRSARRGGRSRAAIN